MMKTNVMYGEAYGSMEDYRLGGLKAMFVAVLFVVMLAGSLITSLVAKILPHFGIVFAELFAVAELAAPLFLLWRIARKACHFWDELEAQTGLQVPNFGKGLLRFLPRFYAGVIAVTVLCAVALWIVVLTTDVVYLEELPRPLLSIGCIGMAICAVSWLFILPLYIWRKLTQNTKLICRQIGIRYDGLVHNEGGSIVIWGGLVSIIFWTFLIFFQPIRLMFRAMKHHDALIDLLETNTGLAQGEAC